jgi:hypothetical protein
MIETKYCIVCGKIANCWFGKVYSTRTKIKKTVNSWGMKERHTHIDAGFCDIHKHYNIDRIKKIIQLNPHIDFDCQYAKEHGGTDCFGIYNGEIRTSIVFGETFGWQVMQNVRESDFNKKNFPTYYIRSCRNNLKKRFLNDHYKIWFFAKQQNTKFVKSHKLNDLDEKIILYEKKRQMEEKWKKETARKKSRERRALLKNIVEIFTENEWVAKKNATNGICPSCNTFVGIEKLTLDHIFPVSKAEEGRIYTIDDVQPLCKPCNARKNDN